MLVDTSAQRERKISAVYLFMLAVITSSPNPSTLSTPVMKVHQGSVQLPFPNDTSLKLSDSS
jgi:hypothetical protein